MWRLEYIITIFQFVLIILGSVALIIAAFVPGLGVSETAGFFMLIGVALLAMAQWLISRAEAKAG